MIRLFLALANDERGHARGGTRSVLPRRRTIPQRVCVLWISTYIHGI